MERRSPLLQLSPEQVEAALRSIVPNARLVSHALLTSGRSNTNYALETDQGRFVLRAHVRNRALGAKEQGIYRLLRPRVPLAPVLGTRPAGETLEQAFSLLGFVQGQSLAELLRSGVAARISKAGQSLGRALAELSRCRFENAGDLVGSPDDQSLSIQPWPFKDFDRETLFDSAAGARLGPLRDELWLVLQEARRRYPDTAAIQMVHGDLNPTNLLFDEHGELAAILDWEFAHAGRPSLDFGNLLRERPELPLPELFVSALVDALRDEAVDLPAHWRKLALLTDLSSALEFLSSPDDRPQTHAAALAQIKSTLARLKA